MATGEFFLTIHPEPTKAGTFIDKAKYKVLREAILRNLRKFGSLTFAQLGACLEAELQPTFSGSVLWYYTTVKLDMEARGEIRRVPNSRPQLIEAI